MVYFNAGVNSALSSGLVGFKADVFSQFNAVLPLALAILVTIAVVTFAISKFMQLVGVQAPQELSDKQRWRDSPDWEAGVKSFDSEGNEIYDDD
jgi:hypothetical protein